MCAHDVTLCGGGDGLLVTKAEVTRKMEPPILHCVSFIHCSNPHSEII